MKEIWDAQRALELLTKADRIHAHLVSDLRASGVMCERHGDGDYVISTPSSAINCCPRCHRAYRFEEEMYNRLCALCVVELGITTQKPGLAGQESESIPMLLWCPMCHTRHIDADTRPAHSTHACQKCGHLWKPALVNTRGVQFLPGTKTEG